jgi:phosphatidylserine/phosphatidylglycerophosphate/cardiolipin synthase-like enzyme
MDLDVAAWDKMLQQTLEDNQLSKSERQALKARLHDAALDDRLRAVLRSRVFEMARKKLDDARTIPIVDWLEEVSKLLLPFSTDGEPVVEAHFSPGETCVRRIRGMLDSIRRSADVCVFTITDNRIAEGILAAHRRGATVRVVTDDEKAHDLGSDVKELARAGVPVRVDDSPYHMHHKFALFDDDLVLTGSYNWTRGAAESNEENLVLSNDRRLFNSFRGEFERLWKKFETSRL